MRSTIRPPLHTHRYTDDSVATYLHSPPHQHGVKKYTPCITPSAPIMIPSAPIMIPSATYILPTPLASTAVTPDDDTYSCKMLKMCETGAYPMDPIQNSPPNIFMETLRSRMIKYDTVM